MKQLKENRIRLFVDDIRDVPDESWTLARTITEAINFIMLYGEDIKEFSLDHDISHEVRIDGQYRPFPSPDTFVPVACFIAIFYKDLLHEFRPHVTIHTANPNGASRLESIMVVYDIPHEIKMMGQAHRKK